MATTLGSPGVSVSVIDESFYTPAAPGTTPLVFVATAQDKSNASGTGIAQGTTAANAGKVWLITSQRDLSDTFGTPLFYTDNSNNPVHGGELNEYGLQAAYSLLGVSSRVYVARADVDLGALTANTDIPKGEATAGTYWLDTTSSLWGVSEWNASGRGSFVSKTPLVINDDNVSEVIVGGAPKDEFGRPGDYAMLVISDNGATVFNGLWYKTDASSSAWVPVQGGFDGGKQLQISPHTQYPGFTTSTVTGSVWVKTTTPGFGANWVVKLYSGLTESWSTVNTPLYASSLAAIQKLDPAGGGKNIPVGTLFVETDPAKTGTADFRVWRRNSTSPTNVVSAASTATIATTSTFDIRESLVNSSTWSDSVTISVEGSTTTAIGSLIATAINLSSDLENISASWNASTNKLTISHVLGGDFELADGTETPLALSGMSGSLANVYSAPEAGWDFFVSNWRPLVYEATGTMPFNVPENGTLWYDANLSEVDIMINDGTNWVGYRKYADFYNNTLVGGVNGTDPLGPTVSATAPTKQQDGVTDLVDGDIWIDTSDIDRYGKNVYVYDGELLKWVLQDVTDQTSPNGWVFADARWGDSGNDSMLSKVSIENLLVSNYVDPDCVDPALYPKGTKLWNLRRSGFNVKKYEAGRIDITENNGINIRYENDNMSNYNVDRWVTISSNNADGSGTFGRLAQRMVVVQSLKSTCDTNQAIRDTDTVVFNLIASPGYPELISNMAALNTDRKETALVVGDTPFRLAPTATSLSNWGNNVNNALDNGDDGLVTRNPYVAVYYPSGFTNDNSGNSVVVPPSHMMLRTILNSDNKSYPWFAPAGTNRGNIDNATSVGYINAEGEFNTVSLYEGLRDVMFDVEINPLATLPGVGLVAYGQKTLSPVASALDRINVARLVAFLRRQLEIAVKPYLFEPNDAQTRNEVKNAVESILVELVGQRALNDFIVVCDTSNNTPARIDRSELWVDVAIEPVKAVEFIYIPLRLLNTGAIASGDLGATFPGSG
jgi:hypothetical protein